MNALPLLLLSVVGAGDVELLDFTATWCGPCQQVKPIVHQLEQEGYPVRMVDVDQNQQLAQQHGVQSIPCFVMLVDGREVGRVVGPQSYDQFKAMFAQAGYTPGQQAAQGSAMLAGQPAAPANTAPLPPSEQALAASVRLKVEDSQGNSFGTGTIIDSHGEEALIVTCGHIFRDSQGQGPITVDLFRNGQTVSVKGQLISYDLTTDVGLVAIRTGTPVRAVRVAPPEATIAPGQNVFSIGCDRGAAPSLQPSHITTVNRYGGPANIEVAGRPVEGRSGGGLFNTQGELIGICNADIASDNEGFYAALSTVQGELDRNNLAFIYQHEAAPATDGEAALVSHETPAGMGPLPEMPGSMPQGGVANPQAVAAAAAGDDTEVICIVRSRGQSEGGECFVLDRPSDQLLERLTQEYRTQTGQVPTNLRLQR